MQQGEARRSLGGHVVHHRVAAGIGFQRPLPVARRPLQPGEGLLARHAGQAAAGGNHGIGVPAARPAAGGTAVPAPGDGYGQCCDRCCVRRYCWQQPAHRRYLHGKG
ncbi:hypothetical protein G6F51_014422 [Rhizopus arrhizus]|uniref:Uncharacterized protein n=1 Tax=Rhizopus oryzae TaxID=64495 RepID=A0A9P6XMY7_RHIOR|nr:hypothetical protein G6F51_014422 [Rhizopus arrhizus]